MCVVDCFVTCTNDMSRLGYTIKLLRERAGMNQDELCEGICERTFLSKLENGCRKAPSIVMLSKLCQKLNISMDDLFLLSFGDNDEILSVVVSDINALIYSYRFDEAYEFAKIHLENVETPIYKQLYLLTKALHYFYKEEYDKVIFIVEEAIALTTSLTGPLYTLTELRLVNMFLNINIVKYRIEDCYSIRECFDNFSYYLQNNYVQNYREIGFMYLSVCEFFLYDYKINEFKILIDQCLKIFKENNFLLHQQISWNLLYLYHCICNDYKNAYNYYLKLKSYCDLFGNKQMKYLNTHIEHFSDRLNRDISPEAIKEVISHG